MITEKEIDRINALYHKSKKGGGPGLTAEEEQEQAALRRAYIDAVKHNLGFYLQDIKDGQEELERKEAEKQAGKEDQAD